MFFRTYFLMLHTYLLLFNFQGPFRRRSRGILHIISQPLPFVKPFFKLFQSFLRLFKVLCDMLYCVLRSLISLPYCESFVKGFFQLFSIFS